MQHRLLQSAALFLIILPLGCESDARSAWEDVIKKCAVSDLNSSKLLFFGASNNLGPGTVWRKDPDGGYDLRYSLDDMPGQKNFVEPGSAMMCDGSATTNFDINATAGLTATVMPISADLSNDFKRATSVQVKATSMHWDLVREGPYESYISSLPATSGVRPDLATGTRLVLDRALRVTGFTAQLQFSDSDAAALKAKYSGNLGRNLTGDLGANLSANWTADNKLNLTSTDFYIAGDLHPYNPNGFAAAEASHFGNTAIDIADNPPIRRDSIE